MQNGSARYEPRSLREGQRSACSGQASGISHSRMIEESPVCTRMQSIAWYVRTGEGEQRDDCEVMVVVQVSQGAVW